MPFTGESTVNMRRYVSAQSQISNKGKKLRGQWESHSIDDHCERIEKLQVSEDGNTIHLLRFHFFVICVVKEDLYSKKDDGNWSKSRGFFPGNYVDAIDMESFKQGPFLADVLESAPLLAFPRSYHIFPNRLVFYDVIGKAFSTPFCDIVRK